ncbi:phospholipase D family protein [Aquimarina agarivorans]|uniref:phospholipase D family protein n=1 Tax=Aquimarina agarivorans TaxID=980584 RepID=UPI000248E92D|nr:phospholipase D family protein [Aquimarina agarivorans]
MAKFLKGNDLNAALENFFVSAHDHIILISPYIKLHDRYKSALLTHLKKPEIQLTVLFGKNEDDISKSMKQEDFEFFKQFPNVEIRFEKRLHAKYYANDSKAMLTSMNFYGFSQNNNIETGILMEKSLKGTFTGENNLDADSWEYFKTVIDQAVLLFNKKPKYVKKNILSSKKYVRSEIVLDDLSDFFMKKEKSTRDKKIGYCIRSGSKIPFNMDKPMNYNSFKKWDEHKNRSYPEKYCHFSGELSERRTSMEKPILSKNWKKAKEVHNLK